MVGKAPDKAGFKAGLRRGGRPSRTDAAALEGRILDVARDLFFTHGYGATSVEAIAAAAGISKRTFYHRFDGKAAIFRAVVNRLIGGLRPADVGGLFEHGDLAITLQQVAHALLKAALAPEALALHRLMIAEAVRFPELAVAVAADGSRAEAVTRLARLLAGKNSAKTEKAVFAAEQFLQMVLGVPQRRALGMGKPLSPGAVTQWAKDAVALFVNGWEN